MGARAVSETGGIDGGSFGAGWAAAAVFFAGLGRWLGRVLMKAKDDQIATLATRIKHLEEDLEQERTLCRRDISALNDRIRILEGMTLGAVRRDVQGVVSEIRKEMRTIDNPDPGG